MSENPEILGFDLTGRALYPGDWVFYTSRRGRKAFARVIKRCEEDQQYSQDNVEMAIVVTIYTQNYPYKPVSQHTRRIPYYSGNLLKMEESRIPLNFIWPLVDYKY